MFNTVVPASSSVIAFVTSLHAAMLVVHLHGVRGTTRLLVAVPALAFCAFAWMLTTPAWLVAGVAANLTWTVASTATSRRFGSRPPAAEGVPPRGAAAASAAPPARTRTAAQPAFVPARVLAVIEESESIRTFRLARPPGFDFAAGQFLMVRVQEPGGGGTLARCYSISSSPDTRGYLEISVRRQGVASRALHEGIRPGDTLAIHPPLGRFTVPPDSTGDLVLVAGGIGITPLMSMLRHAVAAEPSRRVTLLYSVRAKADAAFRDELDSVARRHPQARVAITITGDGDPQGCRHGRIDAALIHEAVPDPTRSIFLICGPLAMIDGVRAVLGQMGVAQERVRFEAFEAAQALASGAGGPEEAEGAPGRLRLSKSGRDIAIRPAETLLEASERAGAPIASFCRAGICGTCRTRVLSGSVRCSAEALSEEDRERGYVLPCVAWVTGDCVLEA